VTPCPFLFRLTNKGTYPTSEHERDQKHRAAPDALRNGNNSALKSGRGIDGDLMETASERLEFSENRLMDCLSPEEKNYLEKNGYRRFYRKNTIIHSPGDQTGLVYYILDGRVKIYNISESGKEVIFRFCHKAYLFGLAEVCGGNRREVYAEAVEDTRVLGIDRKYFIDIIKGNPEFSIQVFNILGERLRQAHRAIQSLAIQDVGERLAYLLLKLTGMHAPNTSEDTIGYKLTHQEMANMIGATRSTVTEVINYFKEKQYIAYIDGIITILDFGNLKGIAGLS
jgi:CRP/FNR family transcriptional regulator, cyclic AMP receptor protein